VAIRGFKDKRLRELFNTGRSPKIRPAHRNKILLILDFLNAIDEYAMSVSKNYRITFKWDGRDVYDVAYEDYH
jgi:proteic killer suppression protein